MALVRRARRDPDAFGVLFRRHVHDVHRFVRRRTSNDMLADDITAATFEKAWRALPGFRPRRTSVRPWLFRIAANVVTDHHRSETRRANRQHLAAVREAPLDAHVDTPASDGVLLDALAELGERDQLVLSLRFLSDLTTEETAQALGVSRSHCAVIQHRALAALRRRIEEVDRG